MTISEKTVSFLRNNLLLVLSLAFTALPILFIAVFLAVQYMVELVTEDALWFLLESSIWIGLFLLFAAIIYRRVRRKESYPFLLVFSLFTVQAFIVIKIKLLAILPILLFAFFYYKLFRLYKSGEEKMGEKPE